jgi:membrane-bound ClpP family serine protease
MNIVLIVGLIVLGILFILLEVYLIPGISVAGVAGTICLIGGVFLAYALLGPTVGTVFLLVTVLALGAALYGFFRSKALDRMALKSEIHSKTQPFGDLDVKVGDQGVTLSRLAPIGKVVIHGKTIEGRSEVEMIDPNVKVVVVEVGTYNVLVRALNE